MRARVLLHQNLQRKGPRKGRCDRRGNGLRTTQNFGVRELTSGAKHSRRVSSRHASDSSVSNTLRTYAAVLTLLAFGLGGVVAPQVHQVHHAAESRAADVERCDDIVHRADGPVASDHFHEVDAPDCGICATHHLGTAFLSGLTHETPYQAGRVGLSTQAWVHALPLSIIDIRGPPRWAA